MFCLSHNCSPNTTILFMLLNINCCSSCSHSVTKHMLAQQCPSPLQLHSGLTCFYHSKSCCQGQAQDFQFSFSFLCLPSHPTLHNMNKFLLKTKHLTDSNYRCNDLTILEKPKTFSLGDFLTFFKILEQQ